MGEKNEYVVISETEQLILTDDVDTVFADLASKGMKVIRLPSTTDFYGRKAFVLDVSGVLIEIRNRKNQAASANKF